MDSSENKRFIKLKTAEGREKEIEIDEDGFLVNPGEWCPEFALAIAGDESVAELTPEHWKIIDYLRKYYMEFGSCPPIRMVVKNTGNDLKKIYQLFPTGPAKGACRLAGAPKPTGCV
jgi:tRNA 2-thiouridine synthesizing protein E